MKVLIACRLMSGFVDSVRSGRWQPSGSPAIYRLFHELLDRGVDLHLVFTAKDAGFDFVGDWPERRNRAVDIEGLAAPVTVLAGTAGMAKTFGRWRGHLSDLRQTWRIWREVRRLRPDVLYVDRANILAGALVARLTGTRVVLRVLGVTPAMKEMAVSAAPSHRLNRWAYRSPFALVIGTDEGSGTELWLDRMLRSGVACEVRLNGVDPLPAAASSAMPATGDATLRVALVGRLDALKRCDEVIEAVLAMSSEAQQRLKLHIAGAGDRLDALRQRVAAAGAENSVIFHGAVPHAQVADILRQSDLYISLNRQGNLSNANLEALSAGLGFILPEPDPVAGTDAATIETIPADAAIRLPNDALVPALTATLERLTCEPTHVAALGAAALRAAAHLPTWQQRMAWEYRALAKQSSADVAVVIGDLAAGGAQRVAIRLCEAWCEAGLRVDLITLADRTADFIRPPERARRQIVGGLGQSGNPAIAIWANLRRIRALRRSIRNSDAPVIVSFIAPTNVLVVLASLGLGRRIVISERNDPARQSFGPVWDLLRKRLYRWADSVTANSQGALDTLAAFVPAERLAFVPNPVEIPAVSPATAREKRLLAVGRLHRQKGLDILLDAFAMIVAHHPDWRLSVAGEGPEREALADRATTLSIDSQVDWHGLVADPHECYRRAAIFALPSRYEGTPNVLLEAMAHGLAVVVSNASPGPLELVTDGVSGLVVPAEDAGALARAITRLIEAPELRTTLGSAARARIETMTPASAIARWNATVGLSLPAQRSAA